MASTNCGLYFTNTNPWGGVTRTYLPQVTIKSHTTIQATSYTTNLQQIFSNSSDERLKQASYDFPLYDAVVVTSFSCTVDGRKIIGRVEEKARAQKTFQDALDRDQSAGLLSSAPAGIFTINVGGLPARSKILVNIEYGGQLNHDAQIDGIRFTLPTAIAPRYGSYPGEVLKLGDTAAKERGIQIDVDFDLSPLTVRTVQTTSPSHQSLIDIKTTPAGNGERSTTGVSLNLNDSEMDEDFVLLANVDGIGTPQALASTSANCTTVMATFVPKFKLPNIKPEIVFVADQSGSMNGKKNESLVNALTVFLKSLPSGALFNICAFGTRHDFAFEESKPYTQDTATVALTYIRTFKAHYGGTELQMPIEDVFQKRSATHPLQIILLTDGEIWGEEPLFNFVNDQLITKKVDARLFCLGIGHDVSHSLVEGVARAGRGICQFVTEEENLDQKVVRMLKASLSPRLQDVKIKLDYDEDDFEMVEKNVTATPTAPSVAPQKKSAEHISNSLYDQTADLDAPVPGSDAERLQTANMDIDPMELGTPTDFALFPFNRTTVFSMTRPTPSFPTALSITATSSANPVSLTIPIKPANNELSVVILKLAARAFVHDMEQGRMPSSFPADFTYPTTKSEILEKAITSIGTAHQIVTKYTSFVAVENNVSQGLPPNDSDSDHYWNASVGGGAGQPLPPPPPAPAPMLSATTCYFAAPPAPGGSIATTYHLAATRAAPVPAHQIHARQMQGQFFGGALTQAAPMPAHQIHAQQMQGQLFGGSATQDNTRNGALFSSGADCSARVASSPKRKSRAGNTKSVFQHEATDDLVIKSDDAPSQVEELTEDARLRVIITEQAFDGFWLHSEKVFKAMRTSTSVATLDAKAMTALVLEAFKDRFPRLEEVWELCAEKAEAWLDDQTSAEERVKLKEGALEILKAAAV